MCVLQLLLLLILHTHTLWERNYTYFDLLLLFLLFCCSADVYYVYYCIYEHQVDVVCVWHICMCECVYRRIKITYIQYRFEMIERISFSQVQFIQSISTKCYRNNYYSLGVRTFRFLSFTQNTTKHFPLFHPRFLPLALTFCCFCSRCRPFSLSVVVCECVCVLCFFSAYYAALNVWEHTKATRIYLFNPIANYWRTCLLVAMFAQVLFVCWRWNFKCICSFNAIRISSLWLCSSSSSSP